MPHKCTKCGKIYPDGDYRILNGCECGNNKFLYVPKERLAESVERREDKSESTLNKPENEVVEKSEEFKFDDFEDIESVKIIAPGMYEIRLENILNRDGIVIALQEEGRYMIHLPSFLKKRGKKK